MKRNLLYGLWIAAFGIKMLGASWDASYHFKHLRETTELPHIVNTVGLVLACSLWLYTVRHVELSRSKPLKVIGLGFLSFFIGIPLDEAWHRIFGIDLTTWSPSHSIFYIGTALMIVGTILMANEDLQNGHISRKAWNVILLCLFPAVLEDFWFPLLQQEQGVISYYLFQRGTPIASEDILQLVRDPKSQVYGGIPDWLYGVYAAFVCMFVFRFIRHFQAGRFAATLAASAYVAFRSVMNFIYHANIYPESTVPYFLVLAALTFDIFYWLAEGSRWKRYDWLILSPALAVCVYFVSLFDPEYPIHPPMPHYSIVGAVFSAMLGYWLFAVMLAVIRSGSFQPRNLIRFR
jgi:hypothetical protein